MEIIYTADEHGILYPNLIAPEGAGKDIGTWGRQRLRYLKEHRKPAYTVMKTEGSLRRHLADTDQQAAERFDTIVAQMMERRGIDEVVKRQDQMAWVGAVNNIRSAAKEIVLSELIHA